MSGGIVFAANGPHVQAALDASPTHTLDRATFQAALALDQADAAAADPGNKSKAADAANSSAIVQAQDAQKLGLIGDILTGILDRVLTALGYVLLWASAAVIYIGQYNDFINSQAVSKGWVVARDLANMFFIVIMLSIAVFTIVGNEQYGFRKNLVRMIGVALAVNFSKTICGIMIDAGQVVMLTFMGAIANVGGGNFATFLGIPNLYQLRSNAGTGTINNVSIFVTYAVAFVFVAVAVAVLIVMFFVLLFRVIHIWFLIVMSPLVFVLSLTGQGKSFYASWWKDITGEIVTGPVLAFFLWLSFAILPTGDTDASKINISKELSNDGSKVSSAEFDAQSQKEVGLPGVGITNIGGFQNILGYCLGIAMLIGSLVAASQVGGSSGKIAGKWAGKIQDGLAGKTGAGWNPIKAVRDVGTGVRDEWAGRLAKRDKEFKEKYTAKALGGIAKLKEWPKSILPGAAGDFFKTQKERQKAVDDIVGELKKLEDILAKGVQKDGKTPLTAKDIADLNKQKVVLESRKKTQENRNTFYNKLDKYNVPGVGGLALAAALAPLGPLAAAAPLVPVLMQMLAASGEKDRKSAGDFKHNKTMEAFSSDKLKDVGINDRERILKEARGQDVAQTDSERDASLLKAIDKGWMTVPEATAAIEGMKGRSQDKTIGKAKSLLYDSESRRLNEDIDRGDITGDEVERRLQQLVKAGINEEDVGRLRDKHGNKYPGILQKDPDRIDPTTGAPIPGKDADQKRKDRLQKHPEDAGKYSPDSFTDPKLVDAILDIPKAISKALEVPANKIAMAIGAQSKLATFDAANPDHLGKDKAGVTLRQFSPTFQSAAETAIMASKDADKAAVLQSAFGHNAAGSFAGDDIRRNSFVKAIAGSSANSKQIIQALDPALLAQDNEYSQDVAGNLSVQVLDTIQRHSETDEKDQMVDVLKALRDRRLATGKWIDPKNEPPRLLLPNGQPAAPRSKEDQLWIDIVAKANLRSIVL